MKVKSLLGILAVVCIIAIAGCAMNARTMKTGKGESVAVNLLNDQEFKNDHLVKVALERDKNSGFYGLQTTYMNDVAYTAFVNQKDFPNDSKITLAFFDFSYDVNEVVSPGKKMWSAMMLKTAIAEITGNWLYCSIDYQTLKPKFPDPVDTCYTGCHMAKKSNDYVFLEHPRK